MNKLTKIVIVMMALIIFSSLSVSAFAQTVTDSESAETKTVPLKDEQVSELVIDEQEDSSDAEQSNPSSKRPFGRGRGMTSEENLPERPMKDDSFTNGKMQPNMGRQQKGFKGDPRKMGEMSEEELEKLKENLSEGMFEGRKHRIDFSELPEDPTDEEIVEFFKKYFMGNGEEMMKNFDLADSDRPFGGRSNDPRHPYAPTTSEENQDEAPADEPVESETQDIA